MKKHLKKIKSQEEDNINCQDNDQNISIMHRRSLIKHGNYKFDVNKDIDEFIKIKIIDFSKSCWNDTKLKRTVQKRQYRAPEILLKQNFDNKIDIWSLGCIIFEMITGEYLFNPKEDKQRKKNINENHFEQIQELLGPFPFDMIPNKIYSEDPDEIEFRDNDQQQQSQTKISLYQLFIKFFQIIPNEAKKLSQFLMKFLAINPKKRLSALELLQDSWLNEKTEQFFATKEQVQEYLQQEQDMNHNQYFIENCNEFDFYADYSNQHSDDQNDDTQQYQDFYEDQIKNLDQSFKQIYNPTNDLSDFQQQDNTANWFFDQKLFKQLQWIIFILKFFK